MNPRGIHGIGERSSLVGGRVRGEGALDRDPVLKTFLLTEVNRHIYELATEADWGVGEPVWEFFCECGQKDCAEQVKLTLATYASFHDGGRAVLARGHELSEVERATRVREDVQALLADAQQQVDRTRRNRAGRSGQKA